MNEFVRFVNQKFVEAALERAEHIVRDYFESRIALLNMTLTVEAVSLVKIANEIRIAFTLKSGSGREESFSTAIKEEELLKSEHPVTWHLEHQLKSAVRLFNHDD